jgi:hypothetical protein
MAEELIMKYYDMCNINTATVLSPSTATTYYSDRCCNTSGNWMSYRAALFSIPLWA